MSCLKGRKKAEDEPGNYRCRRCGATSEKKRPLCKPKKIK